MKAAFDQQQLIDMFAGASARQGEQIRQAVRQAVLGALQGRELSLKNIRDVLGTVTKAATAGAAQSGLPRRPARSSAGRGRRCSRSCRPAARCRARRRPAPPSSWPSR